MSTEKRCKMGHLKDWDIIEKMIVGDYSPDQPRDENGRWTDGISPEAREMISQLKRKKLHAKYNPHEYASYSSQRIATELRNSMAQFEPDYAQDYIAWVDPDDFLYATTSNREERELIKQEAGSLNVEELKSERQPIYLNIDLEGERITGHEGRHRMAALAKEGVKKVPVIIHPRETSYNRYHTEPIRLLHLNGQEFEGGRGAGFNVYNAIPLSERYGDIAKEVFSGLGTNVEF